MSEETKVAAAEEAAPARDIVYEEAIEAILFASGEPVEAERIAQALEISVEDSFTPTILGTLLSRLYTDTGISTPVRVGTL